MELNIIYDKEHKEEILIYAHEKNSLVTEIEELVEKSYKELLGYRNDEIIKLSVKDVVCFTVESGKVYAICGNTRLQIKQRLYQLEEMLDKSFVKINQSTIANIKKIDRFNASLQGSLMVIFKNGYKDYVSRRQMKIVKERIGF